MNSSRSIVTLAGAGLMALSLTAFAQTRADAERDPVLKAMLTELDRSKSDLQLKDFQKPFFIQYRIEEIDNVEIKAEFGAISDSQRTKGRIARVTVRVGDNKTDSSSGRGDGVVEMVAFEDDPVAIRSALWTATDQAYKSALAAYAQKQAALKQVQTPPQADDFSKETPLISLAEPLKLDVDQAAWEARVARVSGLYRSEPSLQASRQDVLSSSAQFHARTTTTWLVTSEGTIVRKSATGCEESFDAAEQAHDGMSLNLQHRINRSSPNDLDPPEAFEKASIRVIAELNELRKAPLVDEEYHGPVLLSSGSGAHVFDALMASGFAATRPRLGTEARTNGPFASSYHTRVLPESFDVVDDPTLKSYNGKPLLGAYSVDDEGVPAQAVKLVVDGKLENYLVGREPVRDFPQSNGHGRAGFTGSPTPSIGVLMVTAKNGLSDDELNAKLLAIAKDRDLKSVYYVATLGGKTTPKLLYRITPDGTATGKRELVRGAMLQDLDQRALRSNIEAAGKDLHDAEYFGDVPESVLAPALLFDDVTIRRANEKNDKLPFYPPPE